LEKREPRLVTEENQGLYTKNERFVERLDTKFGIF